MGTRDHYLQRPQIAIVFLSFVVFALPLSYVQLSGAVPPHIGRWLLLAYVVLVGNTHFAITWALYLNSRNLDYFRSSPARSLVYFVTPVAILVGFFVIGVQQLPRQGMWIFLPFTVALAAADFFHVVRQSFGVYEMFKARVGVVFSRSLRRADNWYFLSLFALQVITFATGVPRGFDGRYDFGNPVTRVMTVTAIVLFLVVLRGLLSAWRRPGADRGAVGAAFGYLLLQSASALLVVYRSRLYLPSLAMHYVEYHVLMAPRLFAPNLDASRPVDRVASMLRRHKVTFYVLLAMVGATAAAGGLFAALGVEITRDNSRFGWLLVNLLGGIFLAHYVVEAFVWKFGNPFFRETLAPLYFGVAARTKPARTFSGKKRRPAAAAS